jgi:hypothetical protein
MDAAIAAMQANQAAAQKLRDEFQALRLSGKTGDRKAQARLEMLDAELTRLSHVGFDLNATYMAAAKRMGDLMPPKVNGGDGRRLL